MHLLLIILMLAQGSETARTPATNAASTGKRIPASERESALPATQEETLIQELTTLVSVSGRALSVAESPSERVSTSFQVAPGAPPLLSFRYFEGKQRHRYGKLDLVMDDAGH
jgi:hypothetical protein